MRLIFALLVSVLNVYYCSAQTDSMDVFHSRQGNPIKGTEKYYNSISFNLIQIIRGGSLINYERVIGITGLTVSAGLGFSKFDALGQFNVKEFDFYYSIDATNINKTDTKLRPIYDAMLKYYFNHYTMNTYIGADYTRIANSVNINFDNTYQNLIFSNAQVKTLNYHSNELKLLIGFANDNKRKFYHDFNFGLGYRMINYQKLKQVDATNQNSSTSGNVYVSKINASNSTPWFFISWRIGLRL